MRRWGNDRSATMCCCGRTWHLTHLTMMKTVPKSGHIYLLSIHRFLHICFDMVSGKHEIEIKFSSLASKDGFIRYVLIHLHLSMYFSFHLSSILLSWSSFMEVFPLLHILSLPSKLTLSALLSFAFLWLRLLVFLLRPFSYSLTSPQRFLFCCVLQWTQSRKLKNLNLDICCCHIFVSLVVVVLGAALLRLCPCYFPFLILFNIRLFLLMLRFLSCCCLLVIWPLHFCPFLLLLHISFKQCTLVLA